VSAPPASRHAATSPVEPASPWFHSLYWRIAAAFVALVVLVVVAQSLVFSPLLIRSQGGAFGPGDPNASATAIAAGMGRALAANADADLETALRAAAAGLPRSAYVVMADGRDAALGATPLAPPIRAQAMEALGGPPQAPRVPGGPTGPVVTAPIQVAGQLRGLVVLPPPAPRGAFSEVGRLLSLPGTIVILVGAATVGALVVAPLRRRLRALERAAGRIGGGELDVRADDAGRDEIARLAAAFNRMSGQLAARTEALSAADRMRRQMVADISHELRTPLTAMRGYLDTLAMPAVTLDTDTRARYLETTRQEVQRLERIVADLLELARAEEGGLTIEPRVVATERVFAHVVRRFEREAQAAGVALEAEVAASADQLFADPGRLEQVLSNLVANALRHTPAGGSIRLEARRDGADHVLTVRDTGHGIAAAHLPHVFDRFFKADAARTRDATGSGLGLSIVRAIVERHGGTVTVESRPGLTTFRIVLPAEDGEAPADQSRPSANL
jgi:signal transduction histidine kinase